jgi:hypothetical protein
VSVRVKAKLDWLNFTPAKTSTLGNAASDSSVRLPVFRRGRRPKPVRCWFRVKRSGAHPRRNHDWNPNCSNHNSERPESAACRLDSSQ